MSPEDILIFEEEQRIKLVNKVCGYMPAEGSEEAKAEEELVERVRQIRAWSPAPTDDLEKTQADIESLRLQMASRGRSLSPDAEMSGEKRRRSERSSSRDVLQRRKSRDRFLMQPPHVERPAVSSLVGPVSRLRRSVSDDHGQQDLNTPTQFAALGHRQGCLPQPAVSGDREAGMEGCSSLQATSQGLHRQWDAPGGRANRLQSTLLPALRQAGTEFVRAANSSAGHQHAQ